MFVVQIKQNNSKITHRENLLGIYISIMFLMICIGNSYLPSNNRFHVTSFSKIDYFRLVNKIYFNDLHLNKI